MVHVVLTAIGSQLVPGVSLARGVPLAAMGGGFVALLHKDAASLPPLPDPLLAGCCVGSLPAAVAGTTALGVPAGLVIGLGLVVGAAAGVDVRLLRQVLRALSTDVLFAEWRSTQVFDGARSSELLQSFGYESSS